MAYGHRGKRDAPFSLRLTFEERARLIDDAGTMPLAAYIKSLIFREDAPKYRKRRRGSPRDEKLLAEVLACLGASRLANNLNQLAKAANTGTLFFDPETKSEIRRAADDIQLMRRLLMQALGMDVESTPAPRESTSQSFARAAAEPKRFKP